jgi:Uncharacterized conserved protein
MSRPTTKSELVEAANKQFKKLWDIVDSMPEEKQHASFRFEDRDKNLRDVLVHLHEWHKMVENWHRIGVLENGNPVVPGEGYTWKTLPDLNLKIWKKYQDTDLESSKQMLMESHTMIMNLIETHTNDELFLKSVYKWTKSSKLGAYFVGCTSSHYDWAMKKIKRHIKS